MNAAAIVMEILRASDVRYLFGSPGTTELTFLDALPDSGLEYIVALQEATAVAAADGYAQASGQVGVVNLHPILLREGGSVRPGDVHQPRCDVNPLPGHHA